MKSALLLATALCLGASTAFTTAPTNSAIRPATSLSMAENSNEISSGKTLVGSALAAACIFTGLLSPSTAFAMDTPSDNTHFDNFGSTNILAARSGGRAGGRSSPRAMPKAAPSSRTVINRSTTIVTPPVVVGSPYGYGGGYGGYGYDPTPGIALNLGFSAVNAIGNGMREARQNDMIYQERAQLQASQQREADMAARIRELELRQGGGNGNAPVVYVQPPTVVQQAVPVPVSQ